MSDIVAVENGATSRRLVLLSDACRAIAEARRVDEVKEIRDCAEAMRHYARERQLGMDAQNDAAEIKVRAERRMGEMLREMPGFGTRGGDRKSTSTVRVEDFGLTYSDSSRWQKVAGVPAETFEGHLAEARAAGQEITTAGLLKLARRLQRPDVEGAALAEGGCTADDLGAVIARGLTFGTVYADPPWQYGNQGTRASAGDHYKTMSLDDIKALPVARLAGEKAHCHLWTTNGFLREAFEVLDAWGFAYKSCLVWCKPQMGIGNYWRVSHEFLLLGVRGDLPFRDKGLMSWVEEPRGRHSAKPDRVRRMVERASPGPRLELFGRSPVDGWLVWGNEAKKDQFTWGMEHLTKEG